MIRQTVKQVVDQCGSRADKPYRSYPNVDDQRTANNLFMPFFKPKFGLDFLSGKPIFTIGSCFAREIEERLYALGCNIPTLSKDMVFPEQLGEQGVVRPNGPINEFNPGCIGQKIIAALNGYNYPEETLYRVEGGGYIDLLLPTSAPVTLNRAFNRRDQIYQMYQHLNDSDVVIITLGFVESWYDTKTSMWLNRAPPLTAQNSDRFEFRMLDVADSIHEMEPAIAALTGLGKKVVITVSPVPILMTFTDRDCVAANELTKSTLRVVAEYFSNNYSNVDYFPSYEAVKFLGSSAYYDDNIHVRSDIVHAVVDKMVELYSNPKFQNSTQI